MDDWRAALWECEEFERDAGNDTKNALKPSVSCEEAEQVFVNRPLLLQDDPARSRQEPRHKAFGKTNAGRLLTLTFTLRRGRIRVISARDMHRKERKRYEQEQD